MNHDNKNDFVERYSSYSNADLLIILQNAHNYQQAAVDAAKEILAEREVKPDDYQEANNDRYKKLQENNLFNSLLQSFDGVFYNYSNRKNITVGAALTLAIIAYQIFTLKNILISSISTIKLYYESPLYTFLFLLEYLLFASLFLTSIYYLLKRNAWGWAIITGIIFSRIFYTCIFVYTYFQIDFKPDKKAVFYALVPVIYLIIVFLKPIRNFLNVNNDDFYKVGYIIFIIAVINGYIFALNYIFN